MLGGSSSSASSFCCYHSVWKGLPLSHMALPHTARAGSLIFTWQWWQSWFSSIFHLIPPQVGRWKLLVRRWKSKLSMYSPLTLCVWGGWVVSLLLSMPESPLSLLLWQHPCWVEGGKSLKVIGILHYNMASLKIRFYTWPLQVWWGWDCKLFWDICLQ